MSEGRARSAAAYRQTFQDVTAQGLIAAGDAGPVALVAAKSKYTVYIQEILLTITTDNAATATIRDDAGTPIVAAVTPASPGLGPQRFLFPEEGRPMTADKGVNLVLSAAGLAFHYMVVMYRRPTKNQPLIPSEI